MPALRPQAVLPFIAALLAACAHAPSTPAAPAPVWPAPPALARVRWVMSLPAPDQRPEATSWWRRALNAFLGTETERSARLFQRPFGVAVDGGQLLVADPDAAQVFVVEWRDGRHWPLECRSRPWGSPMAVAVGPDHSRYVSDAVGLIARITAAGECTVFGEGRLSRPTGVAWLAGRVWTVDPPAHHLVVFTPDGQEVQRIGGLGEGEAQLHFPTALAAAPGDTVLVVDALNFRIVRYSADGRPLGEFGRAGEEESAFGRPKAVAADAGGAIYVSDAFSDQVKRFTAAGRFELAIGESGSGPGRLLLPAGLAVAEGHLFVADSMNGRVEIYELLGDGS